MERFNRTLEAMLAKLVKENQKDWDLHIPRVLFAYRTALHESTGYTPYRVNFGRPPTLPVDIMLGRVPSPAEGGEKEVPKFVEDISRSLKEVFEDVRLKLNQVHQRNKAKYDEKVAGSNLAIGDRVWLYVPAVKQGRTKKLSSLWRGPYTVIDRVGTVTYQVQLIGSSKTLVVHQNRLKLCYGEPQGKCTKRQHVSPQTRETVHSNQTSLPVTPIPKLTYADAVANKPTTHTAGGYTTSSDCELETGRPQRNRHPPVRYGNYVTH